MGLRCELDNVFKKYIRKFEEKHDCRFEHAVSDDLTGVISFGDISFFHISDIIFDIDTNQPKNLIFEWINDCVENEHKTINFRSYAMGLRFEDLKD